MLKLELMPESTQNIFNRLKDDPRLVGFTLVGGTALAIQIGHRISEDLDFNIFGQVLPTKAIDSVLNDLEASGSKIQSLITSGQKSQFKINTSDNLDNHIQDYLIDGAKVTFHSRNEKDRPKQQIDFLKSTPKLSVSKQGFNVLGVDGLFVMKSMVIYDGVKSRGLYDLMVLTRDHSYSIEQIFTAINAYQPLRDKDPERFKSVVTGIIPLDKNDEGFSSIHLKVKITDIYKYFKKMVDDYEVNLVKTLQGKIKNT
jgi:predicted nucleotidyltransferase component of viral defense system